MATRMERALDAVQLAGQRYAQAKGAAGGTLVTVLLLLPTPLVDWVTDNLILMATDPGLLVRLHAADRDAGARNPPGEIRAMYEIGADGSVGKYRTPPYVSRAIDAGSIPKDYRGITVPVLALFAVPQSPADKWKAQAPKSEQHRVDSDRSDAILFGFLRRWQGNLKQAVPSARIIELPGGHHYLFQNEEEDALREFRAFLRSMDPR